MKRIAVALNQHFRNSRRVAKVAINLKWGVGVEEIGIKSAPLCVFVRITYQSKQVADNGVGMVAIAQPCPQVDFPAHGPTGRLVAAQLDRKSTRLNSSHLGIS